LLKKILWSLNTAQMIEVIGSTTLRKTVKNVLVTIDKYPIAPDISLEQLQERRTKLVSTLINAFNTIKGYSSDHLRKKFAVALALLGDAKKFCNAYPDKVSQTINKTLLEYHQQVDRKPLIEAFAKKLLALKGEKAQAIRKALPESITSSGSTGTQPENVNIEKPARLDDHSISNFREDP